MTEVSLLESLDQAITSELKSISKVAKRSSGNEYDAGDENLECGAHDLDENLTKGSRYN
ncbi:hypothetical protein FF011L_26970 [Roseimaritima multifibrata]|uniref:Uncharacterized protein n=1 Tax=Roseimaritima multifibrata TaxID=1930274 RepID=A0A517MGA5_9BACT|nr:hypothetical protein [Roseimaritima multifibrata]QDS93920.1 hypothetical protein FF011L_26970 [Roseimaritima multifibrata]